MIADAVVLAAGLSRRMLGRNKLLLRGVDGLPMVTRTVARVRAAAVREIIVVLGHEEIAMRAALAGADARMVVNPGYRDGQAGSLATGLAGLPGGADGVLICLADMPAVAPATIDALLAAWTAGAIVAPVHAGQRGNPVLWDASYVPDMSVLTGDTGARPLLARYADRLRLVETEDRAVLLDADTPAAAGRLGYTGQGSALDPLGSGDPRPPS